MLQHLVEGLEQSTIIQKAKRNMSLLHPGDFQRVQKHDDSTPSFMKSYIKGAKVYDHQGAVIREPSVPVRPSSFPEGVYDHAPVWWGIHSDTLPGHPTWEESYQQL
jgi:hypothetical protein